MTIKYIEELGKEAARREIARAGRIFKGSENMKRELAAAGDCESNGSTFNYPKGSKVAACKLLEMIEKTRRGKW